MFGILLFASPLILNSVLKVSPANNNTLVVFVISKYEI